MSRLLALLLLASAEALAAPTVSMTAPTSGNLYLAPATFAVKANASAPGVGINRVEFYANGTLIGTDTTSPYQFDWTNVPAGTYAITAKAIDNNGAETVSSPRSITVSATNAPPTVSLSAPADNARYLNPASITLAANASGPELNDLLQKVEFFANGTLVGTVTSAPYSLSWQSPALGTHAITAVATDSQGGQSTSSARTLTVSAQNQPPTVSIVTPLDNSKWHSPAGFMFQASANSGEANDTVTVEFYVNGALQGSDSTSPYSVNLSSLAAGTYSLMARAIDGQGAQVDSATRTITVSDANLAPSVSISAPASGANFPTAPAGFTITANAGAGEVNGWVTKVEFYVNGSLVNTDTAGPWSYNVSGLANGTYTLTAKATDQLNAESTSAPITITVGPQAKLHFIAVDHLNTPRLVTNDQQQAVWRWDQQEPFGVNGPDENPSALGLFEFPLRFPGQYADKETNLFYNYFRDYDTSLGRYLESDPIGLLGGPNRFAYVVNRPLRSIDPMGLITCTFDPASFSSVGCELVRKTDQDDIQREWRPEEPIIVTTWGIPLPKFGFGISWRPSRNPVEPDAGLTQDYQQIQWGWFDVQRLYKRQVLTTVEVWRCNGCEKTVRSTCVGDWTPTDLLQRSGWGSRAYRKSLNQGDGGG